MDVSEMNEVNTLVENAINRFGRINILINNAGIGAPAGKASLFYMSDDWEILLNVNLPRPWRLIKAVVPIMIEQQYGINAASTAGLLGYRHFAGYVASEHGLGVLTKSVGLDYAMQNIRVNAACPDPFMATSGLMVI